MNVRRRGKKQDKKISQIIGIICKKIFWFLVFFLFAYHIVFLVCTGIFGEKHITFGENKIILCPSNTMYSIRRGDFLIFQEKEGKDLAVGDIVVYEKSGHEEIGRIYQIEDRNGKKRLVTKIDRNYYPDKEPVMEEEVTGKLVFSFPRIGIFLEFWEDRIATLLVIVTSIFLVYYHYQCRQREKERRKKRTKEYFE